MTSTINLNRKFYLQSLVGTSVLPDFQGGTLRIDQSGATDNNNYTVENSATNAIDAFGHSIIFNGTFSGAGPLEIKDSVGGGTIIVTAFNDLGGAVTIDSGATLQWGNGHVAYLVGSGDSIADNGALLVNFRTGESSAGPFTISGSGRVTIQSGLFGDSAASTYTGSTSIAPGGQLVLFDGGSIANSSVVADNGTFDVSGTTAGTSIANLTASGLVSLGSQNLTIANASGSFSGVLADGGAYGGTGGSLTIAGGTQTLTGTNTFTGTTTINSGATLQLAPGGTVAGSIVDHGLLRFAYAGPVTVGNTISGVGSVEVSTGTVVVTSQDIVNGTVTIDSGATLQWGNGSAAGYLIGGGNSVADNGALLVFGISGLDGSIPIYGSGRVTFQSGALFDTAACTYTGSTTIASGALFSLHDGGSIANSSVVADNGTFDISGTTSGTSIANLTGSGLVSLGSETLTITNASGSFSGVLADGGGYGGTGGALTIAGGTETLTGTNTFTGMTTINSGATLQLGAGGTTGTLAGSIADNGLLRFDYSGVVQIGVAFSGSGNVEVAAGTVVATGGSSVGGTVTIDSGATLQWGNGSAAAFLIGAGHSVADYGTLLMNFGVGAIGGSIPIFGSGGLTIQSGSFGDSSASTYTGSTSIASGSQLDLTGTGSIANSSVVADDGTFDISGTTAGTSITSLAGSGLVSLGSQTLTITGASGIFSGVLADGGAFGGAAGSLDIAGGTQTLSGTNTFTGTTTIGSGATLQLGAGGSTGTLAGLIAFAANATLEITHHVGTSESVRLALDVSDVVIGGKGDETFDVGGTLVASDQIKGGGGADTVKLEGYYFLTFTPTTMVNVETLQFGAGYNYVLTTSDATVSAGQTLTVDASAIGSTGSLSFNGAAETDGRFAMTGGAGTDVLTGGAGNDTLSGNAGDDALNGGAGANTIRGGNGADFITVTSGSDTLVYSNVKQSTHATFDTLSHFDFLGNDRFDLDVTVSGIDAAIASGTLNTATFDGDLAAAVGAAQLAAHHAVLFTANAGTAAGTYLVVDANGTAGYQGGLDYVFKLVSAVHTGSLDVTDFT